LSSSFGNVGPPKTLGFGIVSQIYQIRVEGSQTRVEKKLSANLPLQIPASGSDPPSPTVLNFRPRNSIRRHHQITHNTQKPWPTHIQVTRRYAIRLVRVARLRALTQTVLHEADIPVGVTRKERPWQHLSDAKKTYVAIAAT